MNNHSFLQIEHHYDEVRASFNARVLHAWHCVRTVSRMRTRTGEAKHQHAPKHRC